MNTEPVLSSNTAATITNLNFTNFLLFSLDNYTALSTRWQSYKIRYENLCTTLNIRDLMNKVSISTKIYLCLA